MIGLPLDPVRRDLCPGSTLASCGYSLPHGWGVCSCKSGLTLPDHCMGTQDPGVSCSSSTKPITRLLSRVHHPLESGLCCWYAHSWTHWHVCVCVCGVWTCRLGCCQHECKSPFELWDGARSGCHINRIYTNRVLSLLQLLKLICFQTSESDFQSTRSLMEKAIECNQPLFTCLV